MDIERRILLMHRVIDLAEELDKIERKLNPEGPPPRHAALAYQSLRQLKRIGAETPDR